jgi:hypothetical protein
MSHLSSEKTKLKPPYMCPRRSNHTYSEQYGEQIQYLNNYKLKFYKTDMLVQKEDYRVARKSKHRCSFHMHNFQIDLKER